MKPMAAILFTVALLTISACYSVREMTVEALRDEPQSGQITVVLRSGTTFRFGADQYRIINDSIQGNGLRIFGDRQERFTGSLAVSDIEVVESRQLDGVRTGLLVGGVAAAGVIIAFLASERKPSPPPKPTTGGTGGMGNFSCPLVSTFDGSTYHLESETFAGAVLKGFERQSHDIVSHLRSVDGQYKLRLANAGDETEYVDDIALTIVEHPAGTRVLPDREGVVHTLERELTPEYCVDHTGNNVLPLVTRPDGLFWEHREAPGSTGLRDTLTLGFPKDPGAGRVRLIVRGVNTRLGNFALRSVLALKGDQKLGWIHTMESQPAERARFLRWMMREGMLHVSVLESGRWVEQQAFLDPGPGVVKDQLCILDITRVRGERLAIRLSCTADLWRIDRVSVDYEADRQVQILPLQPVSAVNNRGENVLARLERQDGNYYATMTGDYADVAFPVPPPVPDRTRSIVISCRGFYYPWVDSRGPAQHAVADSILDSPLYGSRLLMPQWTVSQDR